MVAKRATMVADLGVVVSGCGGAVTQCEGDSSPFVIPFFYPQYVPGGTGRPVDKARSVMGGQFEGSQEREEGARVPRERAPSVLLVASGLA